CLRFPQWTNPNNQVVSNSVSEPPNMPNYALGAVNPPCALGVEEVVVNQREVLVYPNPSDGNFTIHLNLQGKERGTAELWDVHGRLVQKVSLDKNETVMSCNGCVPGVYYYRVLVEGMVVGKGTVSLMR